MSWNWHMSWTWWWMFVIPALRRGSQECQELESSQDLHSKTPSISTKENQNKQTNPSKTYEWLVTPFRTVQIDSNLICSSPLFTLVFSHCCTMYQQVPAQSLCRENNLHFLLHLYPTALPSSLALIGNCFGKNSVFLIVIYPAWSVTMTLDYCLVDYCHLWHIFFLKLILYLCNYLLNVYSPDRL